MKLGRCGLQPGGRVNSSIAVNSRLPQRDCRESVTRGGVEADLALVVVVVVVVVVVFSTLFLFVPI